MNPPHLPPHPTSLGGHRSLALGSLHHTSNSHWLYFTYGNVYVSMLFSHIILLSPSPTVSFFRVINLLHTSKTIQMHPTSTQGHHAPAMSKPSGRAAHIEKLEPSPSGNIRDLIRGQYGSHTVCFCSDPHPLPSLSPFFPEATGHRDKNKEFCSLHEASQKILSNQDCVFPSLGKVQKVHADCAHKSSGKSLISRAQ